MLNFQQAKAFFQPTPIPHQSAPFWIRICSSSWWYLAIPIHMLIALKNLTFLHNILQTLIILVGVGLLGMPSYFYPRSQVARSWRIIQYIWIILFFYQLYSIFNPKILPTIWLDGILLSIYLPIALLLGYIYSEMPFQRRSRLTVFIESVIIGIALTTTFTNIFHLAIHNVVFIISNVLLFYTAIQVYQQSPKEWRDSFHTVQTGFIIMIIGDCSWLWLFKSGYPTLYTGPIYTLGWLVFTRTALVLPKNTPSTNSNSILVNPLQDALGIISLLICLTLLIYFGASNTALVIIILLIVALRIVESIEYKRLYAKIDTARHSEGRLRFFVQNLSHALKTPLNGLGRSIRRREATDPGLQHYYTLQRRITSLIDLSRTTQMNLVLKPMRLDEVVAEVQTIWQTLSHAYPNQIQFELAPYQPTTVLMVDRTILVHIMENILSNAIHAQSNQCNGLIRLSLDQSMNQTIITIEDHGSGFAESILNGNYTSHSTNPDATGLGLISIMTLAHEMNGCCELSNTDHGAKVRLAFPTP